MNRTILQRRRQRERWKRLAVEVGPHPSLPPRWRRSERRRRLAATLPPLPEGASGFYVLEEGDDK